MEVESQSVAREQPCKRLSGHPTQVKTERRLTDELAATEDDEETDPDGFSEADETVEELDQVVFAPEVGFHLFETHTSTRVAIVREGYKEPDNTGDGEEDGGKEEAVVVAPLGDGGGRGESRDGTRNFVEHMLDRATWLNEPQKMVNRQLTTVASILLSFPTFPPTISQGLKGGISDRCSRSMRT